MQKNNGPGHTPDNEDRMLLLTIALTAGTVGATVVGDHVLEIERPKFHTVFLYIVMISVLVALVSAEVRGAFG
jgi:uncharacterized membrane protein YsdA (DUF1294 family)